MVLVFLLSLHLFLMLCYVVLIETKKSRLSYGHWLFALFIPFVGEFCLLFADIGRSPASNSFAVPFKSFDDIKQCVSDKNGEYECCCETITRQQLLEIIQKRPANFEAILKSALSSKDIEVVHIAASTIMKLQREHENALRLAAEEYGHTPNNMNKLKRYIEVIDEYYSKDLLSGNAAAALLKQQQVLIEAYLKVLPDDRDIGMLCAKNNMLQGNYNGAIDTAEALRYRNITDIDLWELSIQICLKARDEKKLNEILKDSEKMIESWSIEQKKKWKEIKSELEK